MGNDFFYSGALEDEKAQEMVIDFAKYFYYDPLIIDLELKLDFSFSENKKFIRRKGVFNVFGIIPDYSWDTDHDRLMKNGQIIFDRTSGGRLVSIHRIPKIDDLIVLKHDENLLDHKTFIEPNGYNRLVGGSDSVFALFLYIIRSRYFSNLKVSDDYYAFKNTSAMILDFDLHSTLMDDALNFDECFNIFEYEYLKRFPPKIKKKISKLKQLSDYFTNPPKEPFRSESIYLDEIDFSVRTQNVIIKRLGLKTLADLLEYSVSDLFKVQNSGRKTIKEINNFLELLGLKLSK